MGWNSRGSSAAGSRLHRTRSDRPAPANGDHCAEPVRAPPAAMAALNARATSERSHASAPGLLLPHAKLLQIFVHKLLDATPQFRIGDIGPMYHLLHNCWSDPGFQPAGNPRAIRGSCKLHPSFPLQPVEIPIYASQQNGCAPGLLSANMIQYRRARAKEQGKYR